LVARYPEVVRTRAALIYLLLYKIAEGSLGRLFDRHGVDRSRSLPSLNIHHDRRSSGIVFPHEENCTRRL